MTRSASGKAIIVGGGIVGAACALYLGRAGLQVAVLEAAIPGGGTTAAGMGHLVVMDDSPAQLALTAYSLRLWRELYAELPTSCEVMQCGTLWVATDDAELEAVLGAPELLTAPRQEIDHSTR